MSTIARARAFYGVGNIPFFAHSYKCKDIVFIAMLATFVIKIGAKKGTVIVGHYAIQSDNITTVLVFAFQMAIEVLVSEWRKMSVRTICTFEFLFVAYASPPLVDTDRLVTALASCFAEPSSRKNIFSAFE